MKNKETAKEFINRLRSMPNADLTDKEIIKEFGKRIQTRVWPEIRKQDVLWAKSAGRAFTMVVTK